MSINIDPPNILRSNLTLSKEPQCLGSGSFGQVYKYSDSLLKNQVAVKRICIAQSFTKFTAEAESKSQPAFQIVSKLLRECENTIELPDSPFVVKTHSAWLEGPDVKKILEETKLSIFELMLQMKDGSSSTIPRNFLYIKMELCDQMTLEKWLEHKSTFQQREKELKNIQACLARGLKHIHENGIIHRDIKPGNIFKARHPQQGLNIWKLGDFGLSIKLETIAQKSSPSFAGAEMYQSPEMHLKQSYNSKTDIYPLGLIFLELVLPEYLDFAKKFGDFEKIRKGLLKIEELVPEVFGNAGQLISRMTATNIERRMEMVQVYNVIVNHFPLGTEENVEENLEIAQSRIQLPYIYGLTQLTKIFAGRLKEFDILESHRIHKRSPVIISGLGGIGKTELAKQYATKIYEAKSLSVLWLQAFSVFSLESDLDYIAQDLEISLSDQVTKKRKSVGALLREIQKGLRRLQFLIIIDNYDEENEVAKQIMTECRKLQVPQPLCIVTTKNLSLLKGAGQQIKLGVLSNEEAHNLVKEYLELDDRENFEEKVDELCQLLHNFPLALQQMIAFIREEATKVDTKVAMDTFIQLFNTNKKKALSLNLNEIDNDYKDTAWTTWTVSINRIQGDKDLGEVAENIITILALWAEELNGSHSADTTFLKSLAYHKIQEMECVPHKEVLPEVIGEAIGILVKYSLVQKTKARSSLGLQSKVSFITIHPLVQEVVRISLRENGKEKKLISNYFSYLSDSRLNIARESQAKIDGREYWINWLSKLWSLSSKSYPGICKQQVQILEDMWELDFFKARNRNFLIEALDFLEEHVGEVEYTTLAINSSLIILQLDRGDCGEFLEFWKKIKVHLGLRSHVVLRLIKRISVQVFLECLRHDESVEEVLDFLEELLLDLIFIYGSQNSIKFQFLTLDYDSFEYKPFLETSQILLEITNFYTLKKDWEGLKGFCQMFADFALGAVEELSGYKKEGILFAISEMLVDIVRNLKNEEFEDLLENRLKLICTSKDQKCLAYLELKKFLENRLSVREFRQIFLLAMVTVSRIHFDFGLLKNLINSLERDSRDEIRDHICPKEFKLDLKQQMDSESFDDLDNICLQRLLTVDTNTKEFYIKIMDITNYLVLTGLGYSHSQSFVKEIERLLNDDFKSETGEEEDKLVWVSETKYNWLFRSHEESFTRHKNIFQLIIEANCEEVENTKKLLFETLSGKNESNLTTTEIFWALKQILIFYWKKRMYSKTFDDFEFLLKQMECSISVKYLAETLNSIGIITVWLYKTKRRTALTGSSELPDLTIVAKLAKTMLNYFGECNTELISLVICHPDSIAELENDALIFDLGIQFAEGIRRRDCSASIINCFYKICAFFYKNGQSLEDLSLCKIALGLQSNITDEELFSFVKCNASVIQSPIIGLRIFLRLDKIEPKIWAVESLYKILPQALEAMEIEGENYEIDFLREMIVLPNDCLEFIGYPQDFIYAVLQVVKFMKDRRHLNEEDIFYVLGDFEYLWLSYPGNWDALRKIVHIFVSVKPEKIESFDADEVILFIKVWKMIHEENVKYNIGIAK